MKFLLAMLMMLVAVSVSAQTSHPCDQTPQTVAKKGTIVGLCAATKDEDGVAVDVFNFTIYVDGKAAFTITNAKPITATPNAAGLVYFEYNLPTAPRGLHNVTAEQFNEVGKSPVSDVVLWQVGGKPVKPTTSGIK